MGLPVLIGLNNKPATPRITRAKTKPSGCIPHCGLKVSRFQAKIDENFAHYFLKTKANNKCFLVLNVYVKGYRKVLVS